jgi:Leucine-rich repeat (LRR) protein
MRYPILLAFYLLYFWIYHIQLWALDCKQVEVKDIIQAMKLNDTEVIYHEGEVAHIVLSHEIKDRELVIPITIICLKNLSRMVLRNVRLQHLPEDIGDLSHLYELDVSGNNLSDLPNSLAKLNNLKTLNLGQNKFKNFPLILLKMKNLQELKLHHNFLTQIPVDIEKMKTLIILDLSFNKFFGFPAQLLVKIKNLRELYWAGNPDIPSVLHAYLKKKSPHLNINTKTNPAKIDN